MEILVALVKYGFLVALVVEAVLIGRALFALATEKARAAQSEAAAPTSAEE